MGGARLSQRIGAPAAQVWNLVRWENEAALVESGAFVRVEYDERRAVAGATRALVCADGAAVRERLESVFADEMRYVYRVVEPGPMPLDEYVGEACVEAVDDDSCRLTVSCTFETSGVTDEEWAALYASIQARLFAFLRQKLEARAPAELATDTGRLPAGAGPIETKEGAS
ncbi:MAG TPA: SRPBCC family protein [Candidatus Limnocylindrales bacterium]|nr:SRPBCC family protein [Candidatus Limnocylindrales bacterium]